jgi:hypothetical protein
MVRLIDLKRADKLAAKASVPKSAQKKYYPQRANATTLPKKEIVLASIVSTKISAESSQALQERIDRLAASKSEWLRRAIDHCLAIEDF